MKAFPDTVQPKTEISGALMALLRYPQDLFKVQRELLTRYHVKDATTFLSGSEVWQVPDDPTNKTGDAGASVLPEHEDADQQEQTFSLTTTLTPNGRDNLSAFMAVNADPGTEDYGKIRILKLPTSTTVSGPKQVQSQFNSQQDIAETIRLLRGWRLRGRVRQSPGRPARRGTALRGAGLRARWRTEVPAAAEGAGDLRRSDRLRGHPRPGLDKVFGGQGATTDAASGRGRGSRRGGRHDATADVDNPTVQEALIRRPEGLRGRPGSPEEERLGGLRQGAEGPGGSVAQGRGGPVGRRGRRRRRHRPQREPEQLASRLVKRPPRAVLRLQRNGAGWSSSVARWAHNPEVAGSNPVPATQVAKQATSKARIPQGIRAFVMGERMCRGG
ncbi:hypothetical protein GCM10023238_39010 [Streptomyces heliomycini]